jgi:hypothetical protein
MSEIDLNKKITEIRKEYGITEISLLVFRIKGKVTLEAVEDFVNNHNLHKDECTREGFSKGTFKKGNVLTAYYGKEGIRTLRFVNNDSIIIPYSLNTVPDLAKIQFKKDDGSIDVLVFGGNEQFIERSVHRVLNQIAGITNSRLFSPNIDQAFVKRLCLKTHRKKVEFLRIDPSKSKNYAQKIEEEFKKERIRKYIYVVEEGQFKGKGILESKGLRILLEKEPDIKILEYKSTMNVYYDGKQREIKYQLNANGKVGFFVGTGFIKNFTDEFEAAKSLLDKLNDDSGKQMLLTDDIEVVRAAAQKGLIDYTLDKKEQINLLNGHMKTKDYSALPAILKDVRNLSINEKDRKQIVDSYITLLEDDLISAYDLTDYFMPFFNEVLVNEYKQKLENFFRGMNGKTLYKFIQKNIDPLAEIINPIISEKEAQRNDLKILWEALIKEPHKNKKGKRLEEFSTQLFSFDQGLVVDSVNHPTENEEIDLILKNKINDPFWIQLNSPFIFIECKNWSSSVGSPEIKLFKSKVDDHKNVVRVGFMISVNGFAKGLTVEQIRAVSQDKILCGIEGKDIEFFLNSKTSLIEFLEEFITRSIK